MDRFLMALFVVLNVCAVLAVVGLYLYVRRITRAVKEIAEACAEIRRQAIIVGTDVKTAVDSFNQVMRATQSTMETVGRVLSGVERLTDGKTIADAASKVVSTSRSTLALIAQGVKEAVKAFKTAKPNTAE